jgi:glycosyltransferase involved in cell wall biosynthesis
MKVSIVSCSRNNEKYLKQHIESVQSQTYTNFEHILIDDASTDSSLDLIRQYCNPNNTIAIARKARVTALVNHITAFKILTGDLVVHLDGDDYFYDSGVLDYIVSKYKETDCWATYGSWVHAPGSRRTFIMGKHPTGKAEDIRNSGSGWYFTHLRTFKKNLISAIPAMDLFNREGSLYPTAPDVVLLTGIYEYASKFNKVLYIDKPLVVYNSDTGSNEMDLQGQDQTNTAIEVLSSPFSIIKLL